MRTFVFENLEFGTTAFLGVVYLLVSITIGRKILHLHDISRPLNTQKLFLATLFLSAVLRAMCFFSIVGTQSIGSGDQSSSSISTNAATTSFDDSSTGNEDFFERAEVVMFDFPDFCFVSGYVLLLVIWGESYITSRRHWLSRLAFRKAWFYIYLVMNIIIYGSQVGLYSLLFVPRIDKDLLSKLIFLTLTFYNLLLPLLWVLFYVFLLYTFAGFPFESNFAKNRLSNIFILGSIWTLSRVGYGLFILTSVSEDFFFSNPIRGPHATLLKSIALVSVFLLFEVLPILLSLRGDFLLSLSSCTPRVGSKKGGLYSRDDNIEIFRTPMKEAKSRFNRSNPHDGYGDGGSDDAEVLPLLTTKTVADIIASINSGRDVRSTLYGSIPQPAPSSSPIRSPKVGADNAADNDDDESDYSKTIELDESMSLRTSNSLTSTLSGSFKSLDMCLYNKDFVVEVGGCNDDCIAASMSSNDSNQSGGGYYSVDDGEGGGRYSS